MPELHPGAALRAADTDREQVATVLSTAYAEGRITREEHDERLDQVWAARTFEDLMPITADLVPIPTSSPATPVESRSAYAIENSTNPEDTETLVGIFGGATRKGTWRMAKETTAVAFCGGIDLDLREATFAAPVVEIKGFWCFGGMDIKAPAGMIVRDQTVGIFGGSDITNLDEPAPGAPVLVIKGVALFGGVAVKGPRPSKAERAERRRRRHGCG